MTYQYEFDNTIEGTREFRVEPFRLILEGLKLLLAEVKNWNEKAEQEGAKAPYEREVADLESKVSFGQEALRKNLSWVTIDGLSIGSMRYFRAGLELSIRRRRAELEEKRAADWPSAVLASIDESIARMEEIAETLKVEPTPLLWEILPQKERSLIVGQMRTIDEEDLWDVFVSHASEDKEEFVRPLVKMLQDRGLKVWFDEFSLKVGDSLRRSIDRGLSRSRYGFVVLSPSFFAKEWPQKELDGLVAQEIDGQKVILPVWHKIDATVVQRHSPLLADRFATSSEKDLTQVVADLLGVIGNALHVSGEEQKDSRHRGKSALSVPERMVLDCLRGKPDVRWSPELVIASLHENHPDAAPPVSEIRAAIASLLESAYLTAERPDEIAVTEKAVDYYRSHRRTV